MPQQPEFEAQAEPAASTSAATPPGELDLFSFVLLLRQHLWRIAVFALLGFVVAAIYSLRVKPRYTATTTVVIPRGNAASANLAVQAIGGLDLLGGGFEIYIDIMKSRTVADDLIRDLDLLHRWNMGDKEAAEGMLAARSSFGATPEGLLVVTVEDEDPKLASAIANQYLVDLQELNHRLSITSAGQLRRYYEQQLVAEKNALADAEVALEQSQVKTGLVAPGAQVQANISTTEGLRANLHARQIELDSLRQGFTDQNPNVVRLRAEIAGLEGQLSAQQSGSDSNAELPASQIPARTLAFVRASREVKFHEALFDSLQHEVEVAKEQEAKDFSQIEVLDDAEVPRHKSWPPRSRFSLLGMLSGALIGIFLTLVEQVLRTVMGNSQNQQRYRALVAGKRVR